MIKVLTLDEKALVAECGRLEAMCPEVDMVIGIANGGKYVAERMLKGTRHACVTRQRPSTAAKQSGLKRAIVRRLPYWVLNLLRMAEAAILAAKHSAPKPPGTEPGCLDEAGDGVLAGDEVQISPDVAEMIRAASSVLIVDDAVDSGATMAAVYSSVSAIAGEGTAIYTAALTVTTKRPAFMPQFFVYNNRTLLRFPWSMDYKK